MRRVLRLLLAVAAVLLVAAVAAFLARRRIEHALVYHPTRALTATPAARGLDFADVSLEAKDGVRLHAWHVRVPSPRGIVLHLHGNAGNIADRLPLAAAFAAERLETLLLDYRGYGRSEGQPSEAGLALDADAAFAWAVRRDLPLVIYGESLGGAVAIDLALRGSATALVVQSTFTSLPEVAALVVPFGGWLVSEPYAAEEKLPLVRTPILIIHGDRDELVPLAMATRLSERARGRREMLIAPGAGHNDVVARAAPEIARRVAAVVERNASFDNVQGPF